MKKTKTSTKKRIFFPLLFFILICLSAGYIGSTFTLPSIPTWYAALKKPLLNPPNWIFGPVWTTLYILMAIAAWQIYNLNKKNQVKTALVCFFIQLALNVLWSLIFFGKHLLFWAFVEIILLWLAILITIIKFYKLKKSAGLLLLPYIIWVSFASYLTFSVWTLNS